MSRYFEHIFAIRKKRSRFNATKWRIVFSVLFFLFFSHLDCIQRSNVWCSFELKNNNNVDNTYAQKKNKNDSIEPSRIESRLANDTKHKAPATFEWLLFSVNFYQMAPFFFLLFPFSPKKKTKKMNCIEFDILMDFPHNFNSIFLLLFSSSFDLIIMLSNGQLDIEWNISVF